MRKFTALAKTLYGFAHFPSLCQRKTACTHPRQNPFNLLILRGMIERIDNLTHCEARSPQRSGKRRGIGDFLQTIFKLKEQHTLRGQRLRNAAHRRSREQQDHHHRIEHHHKAQNHRCALQALPQNRQYFPSNARGFKLLRKRIGIKRSMLFEIAFWHSRKFNVSLKNNEAEYI